MNTTGKLLMVGFAAICIFLFMSVRSGIENGQLAHYNGLLLIKDCE